MIKAVASAEASFWSDSYEPGELPVGLSGWIQIWISSLVSKGRFGQRLVEALLNLVSASRDGISEQDAFRILREDEQINAWVQTEFPFGLSEPNLPRTLFSELVAEMTGLLNVEPRGGLRVLDMHTGETLMNFSAWFPSVEFAAPLTNGRALLSSGRERSYVWTDVWTHLINRRVVMSQ
jgi:hypothetical protein